MESERLASAQRAEGLCSALPATTASGLAMIDFKMSSFLLAPEMELSETYSIPLSGMAEDAPVALFSCV